MFPSRRAVPRRVVGSWLGLAVLVAVPWWAFARLGLPSPSLFGGLLGGLAHALLWRPPVRFPARAFALGQALVGAAVGSALSFASLGALGADAPAVVVVTVATVLVSIGFGQLLRLHGVSPVTATFAAIAGGASGMVALAHDLGADDRVVIVVQYLRVLAIVLSLPVVVAWVFDSSADPAGSLPGGLGEPLGYVASAVAVVLGLGLGRLLRLPSPAVLGPLFAWVVIAELPVFADVAMPAPVRSVGFLLIGVQVGVRFTPSSLRAIGRMLPAVAGLVVGTIAVCAGLGVLLAALTGVSQLDAYLATTPGGLPAVLGVAAATSTNLAFVTATQLIRLLVVLVPTPFIARWLRRRAARRAVGGAPLA